MTLPGTTVLDVTDPTGDDNGPGTYQYPTCVDFHAGRVRPDRIAGQPDGHQRLPPGHARASSRRPFGNDFGAQLLDVYVRDPRSATTSTAPPFPQRNYTIAPATPGASASRRRASPAGVGQCRGRPRSGPPSSWSTSPATQRRSSCRARRSARSAPAGCSRSRSPARTGSAPIRRARSPPRRGRSISASARSGGGSPICAVDPNTVPKVMDTIPPPGVDQARPSSTRLNGPVQSSRA